MKIDLSPAAVRLRLEQVEALRRLCLSLARKACPTPLFPPLRKGDRGGLDTGTALRLPQLS